MEKKPIKYIIFKCDDELKKEIKKDAKEMGLTVSAYVRYLIINRHKKEINWR